MTKNRRPASVIQAALIGLLLLLPAVPFGAGEEADAVDAKRREARSLYAQGRYIEALELLEQLDAAGAATGPLLYRLAYCQRMAGAHGAGVETERRAREALEAELDSASDLEVPFYLVNVYENEGRRDDARRIAAETTTRLEAGDLARPETGAAMFRLGKLYEDQALEAQAGEWYSRAIEALTANGGPGGPYVRRASRYVAERAFRRQDFATAERFFTALVDAGGATAVDLDRLAVSRARVGMYAEAARAWRQLIALEPADANRARYGARLSEMAAAIEEPPATAPSGAPWTELTRQELETLLKEQAGRVAAIFAEAEEEPEIDRKKRREYRRRLNALRPVFTFAALEYTLRGYGIRQTAFFGGYAPLILKRSAWKPPRRRTAESD